jgi:hypothetical protein
MSTQKLKTVSEFLQNLTPETREQVELLRKIILDSDITLSEGIKWSAPSYQKDEVDRITFNLMNKEGLVKVVLHMGALRKETKGAMPILDDPSNTVLWVSDIRGFITVTSTAEIIAKQDILKDIFTRWLHIS